MKEKILAGNTVLGIEFGSTRIKAVLIDRDYNTVASGNFEWENKLEDGIWTYHLEDAWRGAQASYAALAKNVQDLYGVTLTKVGAIGISGMMHGYLAFDENDTLLAPFRTWRNNNTPEASKELTALFQYNIPLRWSVAHLYQSVLEKLEHVSQISYMTTLAGYIHWKLTGKKVLGVGDASGMFPVDPETKTYDAGMVVKFDGLMKEKGYSFKLNEVFPEVLVAGQEAGCLTEEGAKLLDPTGNLRAGIVMAPPEGDVGTGMVATNTIARNTGNVSAGTSMFAIMILDKPLIKVYPEIDLCTSPEGYLVANVHVNNGTSELNAWVGLFREVLEKMGVPVTDMNRLYETLYKEALNGATDCDGILSYGYYSGESITDVPEGRPLVVRRPDSVFSLANFMRSHLYSSLATLRIGYELLKEEGIQIHSLLGHGGLFKTEGVGQRFMAAAFDVPVSVMETAGEGGACGMALLAAYVLEASKNGLNVFLDKVYADSKKVTLESDPEDVAGFEKFLQTYKAGICMEKDAISVL